MLHQVARQVESCFATINAQTGKTGQALTENEWLMSIRSRVGIPGGTCSFDLPAYHAWQNLDPRYRQRDLEDWAGELPLGQALELILQLLRETGIPQRVVAEQGVFQQAMPAGRSFSCCACA
jgi:cell division protein ZapD